MDIYAIGTSQGDDYQLVYGPFPKLEEALSVKDALLVKDESIIFRFKLEKREILYRWDGQRWVELDPEWEQLKNFDWDTEKLQSVKPSPKSVPLTLQEVGERKETWEERVLRMLYTLERTVRACSMCSLGRKLCHEYDNVFDPHVFSNMQPGRWMVVGQNPGFNECLGSRPFIGEAGKFFDEQLQKNGLSREHFYITNSTKCHSLGNVKPDFEQVSACEPILRMELNLLKPILVITLGSVAFDVFCPDKQMQDHLGEITYSDKFKVNVYPVYHPSPRNMNVASRKKKFIEDIATLCELIRQYSAQK